MGQMADDGPGIGRDPPLFVGRALADNGPRGRGLACAGSRPEGDPYDAGGEMSEEIDWALELLSGLGAVRGRRMFGGWGLYLDGRMFALIADGELFLKVDDESEAAFLAEGCTPFVYQAKGRDMTLRYFRPPSEALDASEAMLPWARLAWEAAARAAQKPKTARSAGRKKAKRPLAKRPKPGD